MNTLFNYTILFFNMVVVPCVTVPENWEYCFKDMDVWLFPEIQRGWDLYTEREKPYQEEQEILENYK
jgi:hypothetical protein